VALHSNRERMLAFLRHQPIDRVPFIHYYGINGPNEEVWAAVGRDAVGVLKWSAHTGTSTRTVLSVRRSSGATV